MQMLKTAKKSKSVKKKTLRKSVSATKKGLEFTRRFVKVGQDPYQTVEWRHRDCQINGAKGEAVFSLENVEAPTSWSDLAVNIAASKYFRRHPKANEKSVRSLVHRVARTIRVSGEAQGGIFADKKSAQIFEGELVAILLQQRGAFNSPVWFNCGIFQEYGIEGHAGNFRFDAKAGIVVGVKNAYEFPQCSACFIQSVDDDLTDIFELLKNEARVFKYGSGTGTNFSNIRSHLEPLAGGGFSSGLMSFLEVFDRGAAATKSGGVTRRAAKMVCLNLDHPEIREFIWWKVREEEKAAALMDAGFSGGFEGEAYRTVSGQNSNNSVRITDKFLKAVEQNQKWKLKAPSSGKTMVEVPAQDLWRQIATAAWRCADPGVQFHDTIQRWHTCPESGAIEASNPCSEYMFLNDSACNLASINLGKFFLADGSFDTEGFLHTARILFVAQEILIDHSSYPTEKIAENSHRFRPLGLGFANLGATLMSLGIGYDSDSGRSIATLMTALMQGQALRTSIELAQSRGPFLGYKKNRSAMQKVVKQHARHALNASRDASRSDSDLQASLAAPVHGLWSDVMRLGAKHGFRNAQATVLAPTGTIGLLMDCDTTGIEPEFLLVKYKQLAGGGSLTLVNKSLHHGLRRLGYSIEHTQQIEKYLIKNGTLVGAPFLSVDHAAVFSCAQKANEDDVYLKPLAHLQMMAAVQPLLSGAISKTVNLPQATTVEEIQNVYLQAWKLGLKSVAVYRDSSKLSQILSSATRRESISAPGSGFAPLCYQCGVQSTPNGNCFRCLNCGTSLGCS